MKNRPYVICHSLCSIDGKIVSKNWGLKNAARYFEGPAEKIKVDAWIVGRVTMQEFCSKKPHPKRKGRFKVPRGDFRGEHKTKTYCVAIDPQGKCRWDTNMVTTEHVIEVVSEQATAEYLDHLRSKQVSYIIAGKKEIDLPLAMRKLHKLFGLKRVRIDGGGRVNGSFLAAGLIDEMSLVQVPVADGSVGTPTVFDAGEGTTIRKAPHFRLQSIKRLPGSVVWFRYKAAR